MTQWKLFRGHYDFTREGRLTQTIRCIGDPGAQIALNGYPAFAP